MADLPDHVTCRSRAEWRAWLADHHARPEGVWLVTYKKAAGGQLAYVEAVAEAICWGWVDSKGGKIDDERAKLWFAPRKAGSFWARTNKRRVEEAIRNGTMTEAGLAKVRAAQADGTWAALDDVEDLRSPEDLLAAFVRHDGSKANFDAFPKSARRGILEWIAQAKTPATRERRIEETARLASLNERANQWRRPETKKAPPA